jgi:hypothetical protein
VRGLLVGSYQCYTVMRRILTTRAASDSLSRTLPCSPDDGTLVALVLHGIHVELHLTPSILSGNLTSLTKCTIFGTTMLKQWQSKWQQPKRLDCVEWGCGPVTPPGGTRRWQHRCGPLFHAPTKLPWAPSPPLAPATTFFCTLRY